MVSEADRIKAVERVRSDLSPIFGGTPSYKRKRGIYRALKRRDPIVLSRYEFELMLIRNINTLQAMLYGGQYG